MGYDLSGFNPIGATPRPTIDWNTATEEEKQNYRIAIDEWETTTDGAYFRASAGWWTALLVLSNIANDEHSLGIDMDNWAYNDGGGCYEQEKCIELANAIEAVIPNLIPFWDTIEPNETFYCCTQHWDEYDENGRVNEPNKELINALNDMFHMYQFIQGTVELDGKQFKPWNYTKKLYIIEYIHFLRNCGGFNIW